MPIQNVAYAPIWVAASCPNELYEVINEVSVPIKKKRADKIARYSAGIIELTVDKKQTSVA